MDDALICEVVRELFPLSPAGIINYLDLRRPIYRKTAAGGHFGRNDLDLPWEKLDKVETLKEWARVLKPGGRLFIGDIELTKALPESAIAPPNNRINRLTRISR